jgi:hypothetical protein
MENYYQKENNTRTDTDAQTIGAHIDAGTSGLLELLGLGVDTSTDIRDQFNTNETHFKETFHEVRRSGRFTLPQNVTLVNVGNYLQDNSATMQEFSASIIAQNQERTFSVAQDSMQRETTNISFQRSVEFDAHDQATFVNLTIPDVRPNDTVSLVSVGGRVCYDDTNECYGPTGQTGDDGRFCGTRGWWHDLVIKVPDVGTFHAAEKVNHLSWTVRGDAAVVGLCANDDNKASDNNGRYAATFTISRTVTGPTTTCR